jgi:hypothetical protein
MPSSRVYVVLLLVYLAVLEGASTPDEGDRWSATLSIWEQPEAASEKAS